MDGSPVIHNESRRPMVGATFVCFDSLPVSWPGATRKTSERNARLTCSVRGSDLLPGGLDHAHLLRKREQPSQACLVPGTRTSTRRLQNEHETGFIGDARKRIPSTLPRTIPAQSVGWATGCAPAHPLQKICWPAGWAKPLAGGCRR